MAAGQETPSKESDLMGNFILNNAPGGAPSISVNGNRGDADRGGDIPTQYVQAYEKMQRLKKNPLQFLWTTFRLTAPMEIHCEFADKFRAYLLDGVLEKLCRHYSDPQSVETVKLGLKRLLSYPSRDLFRTFFHDPVAMMTQQEWADYRDYMRKMPEIKKKYHDAFTNMCTPDFYYSHGLKEFNAPEVLARIREGVAFDCGSFDGGSIAVMSQYGPTKIIGFEPSGKNIAQSRKNLQKAQIDCDYDIVESCVGDQDGYVSFLDSGNSGASIADSGNDANSRQVPICRLDTYCERNGIGNVSWIKADLEGAALEMVKGAERVIRRDRPLLTLGIYHSPQEFFEIPEVLHQWIPEYKMKLRRCECLPTMPYNELTLIAYVE